MTVSSPDELKDALDDIYAAKETESDFLAASRIGEDRKGRAAELKRGVLGEYWEVGIPSSYKLVKLSKGPVAVQFEVCWTRELNCPKVRPEEYGGVEILKLDLGVAKEDYSRVAAEFANSIATVQGLGSPDESRNFGDWGSVRIGSRNFEYYLEARGLFKILFRGPPFPKQAVYDLASKSVNAYNLVMS